MATLLHRLGMTAHRRWPVFIAAWLLVIVGVGAFGSAFGKPMSDAFSIPGIPSEKASDLQEELFGSGADALDSPDVTVVLAAPEGSTLADEQAAVDEVLTGLAALPQMPDGVELAGPVQAAAGLEQQLLDAAKESGGDPASAQANADALTPLSEDGRVGTIDFTFDADTAADVEPATLDALDDVLAAAEDDGLTAEVRGNGTMGEVHLGGTAELIGIAVALLVLLLTFGSLIAAGLPIVTALVGVGIGVLGITAATAFADIGSTTPMLATMIGLAVGIDYCLFILARYRTELHHTSDRRQAIGIAVGTAGSAVVFAGLTVLIALSALSVVGIPFLTSMGIAAAGTVLVAVLVAITLLPAVLGMLGGRAFGGQVRKYAPKRDAEGLQVNNGVRFARLIGRAPLVAIAVVVIGLGALAVPIKDLHLAFPTDSTAASDTTQRQAADLVTDAFGPGRLGPLLVVVDASDVPEAERGEAFGSVAAWAAGQDDVRNAQIVATNEAGTGAQVLVTPASGPDDTATEDLLTELRDGQSGVESDTGATIGITGQTAIQADVSERLSGALPIYLAVVIGLAFLLLMLVFRSILVPLTATLGFLLSVLATLGVTVAIFQEGLFGWFEPQPIVSFMPIILIGLVFGLAMDYQVFLVTRMREAHVHGMSTREAVVDGFRNSARVVTAAAAIMTAVFAAFILMEDPIIKSMGFALAAAIVFDAFIVRLVLVPALLYAMGEKAWWLPGWLDRILPVVDVEGEKLQRPHLQASDAGTPDDDRESVRV